MAIEEQQAETALEQQDQALEELPVLTVRDTVVFPGAMLPITVGRPVSIALVQSLGENRTVAVVSQLDPRVDAPRPEDLYEVGTVCVMHKAIRVPKENLLLFCEGIARIRTREYTAREPFLKARVERIPDVEPEPTPEVEALRQNVLGLFQQIVAASPNLSDDLDRRRGPDHRAGPAGRLGGRKPAFPQPRRPPAPARTARRKRAPGRDPPQPDARAGAARVARPHPIAGAGPAFPEPARVLSARAVEGHPEGTGRRRRIHPRHGRPAQEAGSRGDERGGQGRGHARAEPPGADFALVAGIRSGAHLSGVDGGAAVERFLRFAGGREARRRDPRRGPLRPGKGEGPHPGLPGRAATAAGAERAHPVLRGPAGSGQDVARQVHRPRPGPQVRAHFHGRHARRGRNPRPPPHLYRSAAGPDYSGPAARRDQRPRVHARRSGQARARFPRRPGLRPARSARPRAELHLPRQLPGCSVRLVQGPLHHHGQRARSRSRRAARPHGDHLARRLHGAREDRHRLPLPDPAADQGKRSRRRNRHPFRRRGRALHRPPLHPRGGRAQPGAENRRDLPQAGPAHRRGRA